MYAQDRPVTAPGNCPFNRTLRSFGGQTRACENEACECFVVTSRSKRGVALRGRCGLVTPSPDSVADTADRGAAEAPPVSEDPGEFDLRGE
ncbi:MAG: hypothetical protein Q4C86_10885 [bacterium]|nr:hypothetical protein [bacterium]